MCQFTDNADALPARSKWFYTEEAHWITRRLSDICTCQKLQRLFSLVQGPEFLTQYSDSLTAEWSFVNTLVRIIFSALVQIGAPKPTQPSVKWVRGGGVGDRAKRLRRHVDQLLFSAKVVYGYSYIFTPNFVPSWHVTGLTLLWILLVHDYSFTFWRIIL